MSRKSSDTVEVIPLPAPSQHVKELAAEPVVNGSKAENFADMKTQDKIFREDETIISEATVLDKPLDTSSGNEVEEIDPGQEILSQDVLYAQDATSSDLNGIIESGAQKSLRDDNEPASSKTVSDSDGDKNERDSHEVSDEQNPVNQLLALCRVALGDGTKEPEINFENVNDIQTNDSSTDANNNQPETNQNSDISVVPTLKISADNSPLQTLKTSAVTNDFNSLTIKSVLTPGSSNGHSSLGSSPAGQTSKSTDLESTLSTSSFWSDKPTDHDGDISGDSLDSIRTAAEALSPPDQLVDVITTASSSILAITEAPKENEETQDGAEDISGPDCYASACSDTGQEELESHSRSDGAESETSSTLR